ncbi:MAG: hypothetical protein P5686_10940 [Limnospira sp. PMC 1254.20]|uniref:hypothetical protein n=1 Tax=Limnospira sp. PMC 1254.20 TaxID=2981052 RepID=UPI0028E148DB|nr:hypothetical protein [Limnospira sp. PMC 1254.20]MDT9254788.1 hypothetical protein [Limnospira sp. PMC 1254.20]
MLQNQMKIDFRGYHILKLSQSHRSSNFSPAERIQSLVAGIWAGVSVGTIALMMELTVSGILGEGLTLDVHLIVKGAIAIISGFLFGVTYRYTVRRDNNPQLKLGVVFAFGLVRGLAIWDIAPQPLAQMALWVGENLVMFAVGGIMVEIGMRRGWIKYFSSEGE